LAVASINNTIGKRFIILLRVDSTNNYAMRQIQNGEAQYGDAWFALEQTAGRGQFNRNWLSPVGENLILSIIVNTERFSIEKAFILNMLAALSAQELFNKYSPEKATIKWANDIYWRDRKAAGILIENAIRGTKWQYAVIGFGININQTVFPEHLKNPVSLKQITGKNYDVIELARELCSILNKNLQELFVEDENIISEKYNAQLYKLGKIIQFKKDESIHSGVVKGVNKTGQLIIKGDKENIYSTGAIEWLHT